MARSTRELPDLRASVPTHEPDDAFLSRLSELAAGSGASRPPAGVPSLPGWRVGLAAVSVAGVVGGAAWVATALTGDDAPSPPSPSPATQPSDPGASGSDDDVSTGGSDSGVGRDETDEPSSSQPGGVPGVSVAPAPDGDELEAEDSQGHEPADETEDPGDDAPGDQGEPGNQDEPSGQPGQPGGAPQTGAPQGDPEDDAQEDAQDEDDTPPADDHQGDQQDPQPDDQDEGD